MLEALLDKYADEGIATVETLDVLKVDPSSLAPRSRSSSSSAARPVPRRIRELETALYQEASLELMPNVSTLVKSIQDIMRKDAGVDGDAQRIDQLGWMLFLKIFDDREKSWNSSATTTRSPLPQHLRWRNWAANAEGITGDALLDFVNNTLLPKLKTLIGDDRNKLAALSAWPSRTPTTT